MSANADVALIFEQMASILEITGANPFRINAYARVARELRDLSDDVAELASEKKRLVAVEGIGDATADKIIEFLETGRVKRHQELLEKVPTGLLDILKIPGLGPKSVQSLWKDGGVTDIASLKTAIGDGGLEGLPRMGAKTIQNIKEAIAFTERSSDRIRIGKALPLADAIVERLQAVPGASRVAYAGSLRRGRETIGDIDILACGAQPDALAASLLEMPGVEKVLAGGGSKCSVWLDAGLQVDLRIVPEEAFGAALLYFTGSKQHNVRLRERAIKRGQRLNEYGLFPDDGEDTPPQHRGVTPVAAATEEDVYAALELPWIPPELREDRGELADDGAGVAPVIDSLVRLDDIRSDLHMHTVASDGKMTIDELADRAAARGYHTIAITDHSKSSVLANGLTEERLREHAAAIREADARRDDIRLLAGAEVDILIDGRLDYDDDVLAELDFVVASPHVSLGQDPDVATARLVRAASHPLVHVIGHPTGRVVGKRAGLSADIRAVAEAAAAHDTALEINANFMRLDLRDAHVRVAVECGALIAIDTDTHAAPQMEYMRFGVLTARRGWLPAERCINTWDADRLETWRAR